MGTGERTPREKDAGIEEMKNNDKQPQKQVEALEEDNISAE